MGLLDWLFKPSEKQKANQMREYLKLIDAYTPSFTTYDGGLYETELIRSVIHAKAKHSAKLRPHVLGPQSRKYHSLLDHQPNKYQSTYDFIYRLRTIYETDTYVFIIPIYNEDLSKVTGLFPLKSERVEIMEYMDETYLRYTFRDGTKAAIEYDRVGVLSKMNYRNEFVGDGNTPLFNTTNLIHMQNQAINHAIKDSAKVMFMAQIGQNLSPEDIEEQRKRFYEKNLSSKNESGLILFDNRYKEFKQLKQDQFVVDEKQMNFIQENVFSYFGVNKDILQNSFDEDMWNAFYEGEIEPFAIQLSQALTNMLFTDKEKAFGNEVHFSSNRLQYASNKTKIEVSQMLFDRGIAGTDDIAEIWNMAKTGDNKKFIRGEYIGKENIKDGKVEFEEIEHEGDEDES